MNLASYLMKLCMTSSQLVGLQVNWLASLAAVSSAAALVG